MSNLWVITWFYGIIFPLTFISDISGYDVIDGKCQLQCPINGITTTTDDGIETIQYYYVDASSSCRPCLPGMQQCENVFIGKCAPVRDGNGPPMSLPKYQVSLKPDATCVSTSSSPIKATYSACGKEVSQCCPSDKKYLCASIGERQVQSVLQCQSDAC